MLLAFSHTFSHADDQLAKALEAIRGVESNGIGHQSAVQAMKTLNAATADQLPAILNAMDGANQLSTNWLRSAVVSIVGRSKDLPRKSIEEYFNDESHSAMGRLLAFELLTSGDDELADQIIPTLIDDPSLPLRHKAVSALVESAESLVESDPAGAIGNLGYALSKARDIAQVQSIAEKLHELGINVSLQDQLGFVTTWYIVGSFDNKDMAGFDIAHGPEEALELIDIDATYKDVDGRDTTWREITTGHETAVVDLNSLIGKVKGATAYALGSFKAERARSAEIRIGTANATKIWLNGELVMSNEIYHNSNSIDKFTGPVNLKKGDNQILIKVCQNEQTERWAQDWQFQLRVCDETGKAITQSKPRGKKY